MPLLTVVLVLIIAGVLLWLVSKIPMEPIIHTIIRVVVLVALVIWLLRVFGVLGAVNSVTV